MKFLQRRSASLLFACALILASRLVHAQSFESSGGDSAYSNPDLAASTARPWNPPEPVAAARPWERALRFPGAVISWPLRQLGRGAEAGMTWVDANEIQQKTVEILSQRGHWGVDLVPASLGDGTGFGGEFRTTPTFLRQHFTGAVSASMQGYNREEATVSCGWLALGWRNEWRPRERFYGVGMTPSSEVSTYGVQTQSALLSLSIGTPFGAKTIAEPIQPSVDARMRPHPKHRTQLRAWTGPREAVMTNGRDFDRPSIEVAHPELAAMSLHHHVEQLSSGITLTHDERFGSPHWSNGWRASGEIERRDDPFRGLQFRNVDTDAQSFTRITGKIEAGTSFGRDPRTIRLAFKAVDTRPDGSGVFLLDDLATLGGPELAGFERGRFHDFDLVLGKLTYVYPLLRNLELDLHGESGEVCPTLGGAQFTKLEQSMGFALRLRSDDALVGWMGFDFSREMTRFRFGFGGVE